MCKSPEHFLLFGRAYLICNYFIVGSQSHSISDVKLCLHLAVVRLYYTTQKRRKGQFLISTDADLDFQFVENAVVVLQVVTKTGGPLPKSVPTA